MGACQCSSQKDPQLKPIEQSIQKPIQKPIEKPTESFGPLHSQKISQEEWEQKLNQHYQSILNQGNCELICIGMILQYPKERKDQNIFKFQGSCKEKKQINY